ncbi:MAG: VOC family protein [Bradyrhizobiaceae bacterium]|nr:VOC family protein [Bradyrhizobiaceae bacterium]
MPTSAKALTPCLWFDKQAEEAAKFYVSVFPNSKLGHISYYGNEGQEIHGGKPGSVLTAEFEINGQNFVALNGGPQFKFTEAISFQIHCKTQKDVDYYWDKLTAGGGSEGPCGWLKDKYGLSWQVVPNVLLEMMSEGGEKADRVMKAFMQMKKFDIAALERAYAGG